MIVYAIIIQPVESLAEITRLIKDVRIIQNVVKEKQILKNEKLV